MCIYRVTNTLQASFLRLLAEFALLLVLCVGVVLIRRRFVVEKLERNQIKVSVALRYERLRALQAFYLDCSVIRHFGYCSVKQK